MILRLVVDEPKVQTQTASPAADASVGGSKSDVLKATPVPDPKVSEGEGTSADEQQARGRDDKSNKRGRSRKGGARGQGRRDSRNDGGREGRGGGRGRREGRGRPDTSSPLTTGLFSGLSDKKLPCKVAGCNGFFIWTAQQQLRNFGKPPPQRMCPMHAAQLSDLQDREILCRNAPACKNTWTWKRGAQLYARQKQPEGELKVPSRLCATCYAKEREVCDTEVSCRTKGCNRTWTWTRDAQIRHRAWLRRERAKLEATRDKDWQAEASQGVDTDAEPESSAAFAVEIPPAVENQEPAAAASVEIAPDDGAGKSGAKRRSKRNKKSARRLQEGPPDRHCSLCAKKFAQVQNIELVCKVHGCEETWVWDRVSQLRAWVALDNEDTSLEGKAPKRMCVRCRDFCRGHEDRDVPCADPTCNKTWRFKTGAQLQHVLSTGSQEDPSRLCPDCVRAQYQEQKRKALKGERMPCAVPGCSGTWLYLPSMTLAPDDGDEIPPDRMCDPCRIERGLEARESGTATDSEDSAEPGETLNEAGTVESTKAAAKAVEAVQATKSDASDSPEGQPGPTPEAESNEALAQQAGEEQASTDEEKT